MGYPGTDIEFEDSVTEVDRVPKKRKKPSKIDKVCIHILNRLKSHNQPQIFSLPEMHKALKEPRHPGGGSYIDNALGCIRRAGALRELGYVRTGIYYVFTPKALKFIRGDIKRLKKIIRRKCLTL